MSPPAWRAVLFDLDGTLADTVELILRSFRHTMRTHLGEVPPDDRFLEGIGRPLPVQIASFARDEREHAEMLATYVAYQRARHDRMVRPFPGAPEVLGALGARGTALAIVTSKARGIARRTLEACRIDEHFEVLVCGDEVERPKPDAEPVVRALEALGVANEPGRVVFVGDSPHDLRSGREAGVRTAAAGWGPIAPAVLRRERPDFFLERLDDVLSIAP